MRLRDKENLLVGIVMASFLPTDQKTELIEIIRKEAEKDCWIHVSERLPKESHFLVAHDEGYVGEAFMMNGDFYWQEDCVDWEYREPITNNVTHWMPLPEAPKEDN